MKTTYIITLEVPTSAISSLRWLLKLALRRFGIRCTDIRQHPPP